MPPISFVVTLGVPKGNCKQSTHKEGVQEKNVFKVLEIFGGVRFSSAAKLLHPRSQQEQMGWAVLQN